jgi:membrane fusion protein (multidrug efflux system)
MASLLRQLLVLALIIAAAAWAIASQQEAPADTAAAGRRARPAPMVEVEPARTARIERTVSAVGTGRARRSVELRPVDSGRMLDIAFAPGDLVEEGAALATLDKASELAALAEAEAGIEEARAAYARAEALQKQGRVTGQSFEGARADLLRAEARIGRARADLEDRVIRAPFAGLVGLTDLTEGALVGRDTIIATLEDLRVLRVEFHAPERFFADVSIGAAVRVETTIHPAETFNGVVVAIDQRVDETSRAFRVRAEIPNPDLLLPSGLFLRVTLVFDTRDGVAVPEQAVTVEGGGAFVYVVDDDRKVERRAITVGQRNDGLAEAVDGLMPGENVITRGIQKVSDGVVVRLPGDAPPAGKPGKGAPRS